MYRSLLSNENPLLRLTGSVTGDAIGSSVVERTHLALTAEKI